MAEMNDEILGHLEVVLAYLDWLQLDYDSKPDEHHIWLNIKPLKEWYEAERTKLQQRYTD